MRRTLLLGVAVAVFFLGVQATAIARTPGGFFGIAAEGISTADESQQLTELTRMSAVGITVLRHTFDWGAIEPERSHYDFAATDRLVANAASRGIRILPILFNPPAWASSAPVRGARSGVYPPRRAADMGRFAAVLVQRYGRGGTFWSDSGYGAGMAISSWQVWNEPNLRAYWPSGPNAREYVGLLKAVNRAVKRIDRSARIVAAGLPDSRSGIPFERFVRGMYRAKAKRYFDVFALHPYAVTDRGVVSAARSTRALMRRYGHRAPIWITEIGWATRSPGPSPFRTSETGQAKRITRTFVKLCRLRKRLRLAGIIYYTWRDSVPYQAGGDFWGLYTGLHSLDGRAKPALAAFAKASKCPRR